MANAIITLKIMPTSPEVDLVKISASAQEKILSFNDGKEIKVSEEPVAFGLKSVNIIFVSDEAKGGTDDLEKEICEIEDVQSCEVTDVRRAIG